MLSIISYILSTLGLIYISNKALKKTPIGKIIFSNTELAFMKVVFWRVDSTFKSDMKGARNLFKWITIIGAILILLASNYINSSLMYYISFITLLSFAFLGALSWGMSPFKETIDFIKPIILLAIVPLGYYIITLENPDNANLFFSYKNNLQYFGLDKSSNFEIALYTTAIILICSLVMCLIWLFLNSVIMTIFLTLSWSTVKLSKLIIGKNGVFYIFCISIILGLISYI